MNASCLQIKLIIDKRDFEFYMNIILYARSTDFLINDFSPSLYL